jgi:prevent-host-death family protein
MDPIPDMVPISEFRSRQNELLEKASSKPILLTRHGHAAAVLLGPASYDRLLEHLEDLQLSIDAVEARSDTEHRVDLAEYLADRGDNSPVTSDDQVADAGG